jgi:hypothetical protein
MTLRKHLSGSFASKLFISVSGLGSELGNDYKGKHKQVEYRFCELDSKMAVKHKILSPVCLYYLEEFKNLLLTCNYTIEKIYESEFGNIKAVARL